MKNLLATLFTLSLFAVVLSLLVPKSYAFIPTDGYPNGFGTFAVVSRTTTTWILGDFNPPLIAGDDLSNIPEAGNQSLIFCPSVDPSFTCITSNKAMDSAVTDVANNQVTYTLDPTFEQIGAMTDYQYYQAGLLSSLDVFTCDDETVPCREWSANPDGTANALLPTLPLVLTPVTTPYLYTLRSDTDLYSDPTTVVLYPHDAAGTIANTYYTIDGGEQQTYSSPFTITGSGTHTITYWSVDTNDLAESSNSQSFTIE